MSGLKKEDEFMYQEMTPPEIESFKINLLKALDVFNRYSEILKEGQQQTISKFISAKCSCGYVSDYVEAHDDYKCPNVNFGMI